MPTYTTAGDSIEGEKITARGRKIVPNGLPFRHAKSKKLLFPIKVTVTAEATIEKEYRIEPPNTTVIAKFSPSSHIKKGDTISGHMLEGHSGKNFRPGKTNVGGNRTSKHPGQSWTMESDCFIELTKDFLKNFVALSVATPSPTLQTPKSPLVIT
jgi:hypothetical protein